MDGRFGFSLTEASAYRAGLAPGRELTDDEATELIAEDSAWRVKDSALRLLARARTRAELRQRLFRKGFAPEIVDRCIADLVSSGLLNDEEYAAAFVRDRLRNRPKGPTVMRLELIARGVDPQVAEEAVRTGMQVESTSELHLARQSVRKFRYRKNEDPRRIQRRLRDYLTRRGFSTGVIREIVTEVLTDSTDERWTRSG